MIATLKNALDKTFQGAPGKSMSVDLEGVAQSSDDAEFHQLPGFKSRPQDGGQGVIVSPDGQNICIAFHDYKIEISLDKGETIIFSYDVNGNVLSSAKCNSAGEFVINGGTKSAVSYADLNTAMQGLVTAINTAFTLKLDAAGQTSPLLTLDISSSEVDKVLLP